MLKSAMLTEVRNILGETTADFWGDNEIYARLDEAWQRFYDEAHWPFYLTEVENGSLASGTATFSFTAGLDVSRTINIMLLGAGDSRPVTIPRISGTEGYKMRMLSDGQTAAWPTHWYLASVSQGSSNLPVVTVRFVPTPSRNFTVKYQYYRNSGSPATSAVYDIPLKYEWAIIHRAASVCWTKELDGAPKAREQAEFYQAIVDQAMTDNFDEAPDELLVAGGEAPQYGMVDDDLWTRLRIPNTLGP